MKQLFFKLRTETMILALSGLMITASIPTFAKDKKIEILSSASIQPSVKYVGTDEKGSGFLVKFDAAAPVKFEVNIKNKAGIVLYSQVFESASFTKVFRVEPSENGDLLLSFTVKTLPDGNQQVFNVTSHDRLITEVVVKKSK
jgi:hypothetical protein